VSRIFWDTNLFVYLIEDRGALSERVTHLRSRMLERGDDLFTSALTLGELLVKPLEAGDEGLAGAYETAVRDGATVVPFDGRAAVEYARIRQDRAIRAPDAIQLACAAAAGIDWFVTNDDRLSKKTIRGIHFVTSLERGLV
jgi:predicted nucleic acid-binding protein